MGRVARSFCSGSSEQPAMMRLVEQEGARLDRARGSVPHKLASPLAGMIAQGWVPPGAPTDRTVETILSKAWNDLKRNLGDGA
jgi:hypothetical protein